MSALVEINGLTKVYGDLYAIEQLNLDVEEGSIFGYIGPNGAGKTTTMMILSTLLRPSRGKATIAGIDVAKNPEAVKHLIGFMPDFFGIYNDMKVWEYIDFFAGCYKIPKTKRIGLIDDLLELVGLNYKKEDFVDGLSRGMKQRLGLARTLIHDPQFLILDEPSSGLDPRARIEIREVLKELRNIGKTMMISSHILPELSEMCTHIGIIERGRLIASGSVEEIHGKLKVAQEIEVKIIGEGLEEILADYSAVTEVIIKEDGNYIILFEGSSDEEADLLTFLIGKGIKVHSFNRRPKNLEDIFLNITTGAVQ